MNPTKTWNPVIKREEKVRRRRRNQEEAEEERTKERIQRWKIMEKIDIKIRKKIWRAGKTGRVTKRERKIERDDD